MKSAVVEIAIKSGFRFTGIEMDDGYFSISQARIEHELSKKSAKRAKKSASFGKSRWLHYRFEGWKCLVYVLNFWSTHYFLEPVRCITHVLEIVKMTPDFRRRKEWGEVRVVWCEAEYERKIAMKSRKKLWEKCKIPISIYIVYICLTKLIIINNTHTM